MLKVTVKTSEWHHLSFFVFIVNFEQVIAGWQCFFL